MDLKKYLKSFKGFVAAALVISLVINFILLSRLEDLENRMNSVSAFQHNIINNINDQTSTIQNVMNDIKKEQSWISTINMEVNTEELKDGQAEAIFEWQVKELHSNSKVVFNYVYGDSNEYKTLPAEELQQGMFQVKVPINNIKLEPHWEVGFFSDNSHMEEMSKKELEERMEENTIKYFVSVSYGDIHKSSEIHTEHVGHLGTNDYGLIQTDIDMQNENMSVTLNHHNVNDSSIVVEEAYLLKYEDETLIGEEKIKIDDANAPPEHEIRFFHLEQVEQYEDMKLVIKVVYSNGEIFEKEVY